MIPGTQESSPPHREPAGRSWRPGLGMRGAPAPEAGVELELDRHQKQNQNQDRAWLPVVCLSVCLSAEKLSHEDFSGVRRPRRIQIRRVGERVPRFGTRTKTRTGPGCCLSVCLSVWKKKRNWITRTFGGCDDDEGESESGG